MNYDEAIKAFDRIKNVYRTHVINLEDVVCVHNALETAKKEHEELSAIKQVVENWDEHAYYTDSFRSMQKIEDIIKGEGK